MDCNGEAGGDETRNQDRGTSGTSGGDTGSTGGADREASATGPGTGRVAGASAWGRSLPPSIRPDPRVSVAGSRPEIVYLDPQAARPVSQYSPEGEIRMMGDLAAGLIRRNRISRPMAYVLVAVVLLPILISVIAVLSNWWS